MKRINSSMGSEKMLPMESRHGENQEFGEAAAPAGREGIPGANTSEKYSLTMRWRNNVQEMLKYF